MKSDGKSRSDAFSRPQEILLWSLCVFPVLLIALAVLIFLPQLRGCSFLLTSLTFLIFAWRDLKIMEHPKSAEGSRFKGIRRWILPSLACVLLIWVACLLCSNFDGWVTHFWTPVGILVGAVVLFAMRVVSWRMSRPSGITLTRLGSDFLANSAAFMVCYTATLGLGAWYQFTGILFAVLNVVRVAIYRVYGDIFKREMNTHGRGPARTFFRGCLDYVPRAYLYTAFSFTVFQVVIEQRYPGAFEVRNRSASLFLDFFYFNIVTISTVGYGDICPNTVAAKLVCSAEILFALFILVAIAGILVQSVMTAKDNKVPAEKDATPEISQE